MLLILSLISLLLIIFGSFFHKMIAIETISVLLVCNMAPYLISDHSVVLQIFNSLSYSNGYGKELFQNPSNQEIFG
jgi:hypothetical protein